MSAPLRSPTLTISAHPWLSTCLHLLVSPRPLLPQKRPPGPGDNTLPRAALNHRLMWEVYKYPSSLPPPTFNGTTLRLRSTLAPRVPYSFGLQLPMEVAA